VRRGNSIIGYRWQQCHRKTDNTVAAAASSSVSGRDIAASAQSAAAAAAAAGGGGAVSDGDGEATVEELGLGLQPAAAASCARVIGNCRQLTESAGQCRPVLTACTMSAEQ